MQKIVQQAIKALNINVPIYRAEVKGNTVTLFLYNHRAPVTWSRPTSTKRRKPK